MCDINKGDIVRWNPNQSGYHGNMAHMQMERRGDHPMEILDIRQIPIPNFCYCTLRPTHATKAYCSDVTGMVIWFDIKQVHIDPFLQAVRKRRK